jgi:uncharacterized membrane protein
MDSVRNPKSRLMAIDALRGAVMIVMALDHVRDFFHSAAMSFSPEDLARTTPALFFTRWITHFCLPVFLFTSGMGMFFWWQRGHTKAQLARFLATRGLWLLLLEVTVMRLAYNFSFSLSFPIFLLVLWGFGSCMLAMAGLIFLPLRALSVLCVAVIALHNCLDGIAAAQFGSGAWIWNFIHQPGAFQFMGNVAIVSYPLLPWVAVMGAGFCFGPVFLLEPSARRRILLRTGIALTVGFVILRAWNIYGDPSPWASQKSGVLTLLSFLRCTKYPGSLDFLLMTLGPGLLALAWLDRLRLSTTNPLIVFGRVPLFYFVTHFYAIHAMMLAMAWFKYGGASVALLFSPPPTMGGARQLFPADFGYGLGVVYAVWAVLVAGLYPLCRWFAKIKAARTGWWWSYV